jgi:hypothetical protein
MLVRPSRSPDPLSSWWVVRVVEAFRGRGGGAPFVHWTPRRARTFENVIAILSVESDIHEARQICRGRSRRPATPPSRPATAMRAAAGRGTPRRMDLAGSEPGDSSKVRALRRERDAYAWRFGPAAPPLREAGTLTLCTRPHVRANAGVADEPRIDPSTNRRGCCSAATFAPGSCHRGIATHSTPAYRPP